MATDRTPTTMRGLLLPDPKIRWAQFSASLSTVSQAGPLPGIPEPQQDTDMVIEATGSQSSGKELRVQALKAGMPGPDEGGFVWSYADDTTRRGWDPPQSITYWEPLDWTTTAFKWLNPQVVRTASHTALVAVQETGGVITVWRRDASTGAWTEITVYTHGAYTYRARPCMCVLPSGRVLLFFWVEDGTLNQNQVRCHYSDDDGATWTLMNRACLREPLGVSAITPGRLRCAYSNGQILLVAHTVDSSLTFHDVFVQYAATDQGANFSVVSTWLGSAASQSGGYHDIVAMNGSFLFAYLRREDSGTDVQCYLRRISHAYEALATAEEIEVGEPGSPMSWGTYSGGALTDGDLAFWLDDDGVLYVLGRDHDTGGGATYETYVARSTDGGDTWEKMGVGGGAAFGAMVFNNDDADRYLTDFTAVALQGRTLLVHRAEDENTNYGRSLCAAYLGGYSTVTLPALYAYPTAQQRVGWEWTWLPLDIPNDVAGVTTTTIGTISSTIGSTGWHDLQSDAGESVYFDVTPAAGSLAEGVLALFTTRRVSGTGTAYIEIRCGAAGPTDYLVKVVIDSTKIELFDMNGATRSLGAATTTLQTTDGVQILIGVNNPTTGAPGNDGRVKAWYRAASSHPDRAWTELGSATDLVNGAAATTHRIRWGNSGEFFSRWRQVSFSSDQFTGQQLTAFSSPGDLLPRSFAPTPVYVDDGVHVAARRGPCLMNEIWHIATRYEHGIEYAHPDVSPSPARTWRSTTELQQNIIWEYDATLDQELPPLSATIGLYLGNVNWRKGSLWGYDKDTAAYVKLADIDTALGQDALRYLRQGSRVIVDSAGTTSAADYFTHNSLAGAHFKLTADQGQAVRKISGNTGGAWTNQLTKRPVLQLEGVEAGDATSGTAGEIWAKDVTVLINGATKYTRFRLRIDAQDTAEGYFYIGAIVLGYFVPFARTYSFGRQQSWTPNNEIVTQLSGSRTVTARNTPRRAATVQWVDGVNTTPLGATSPVPDYILPFTGATQALANPAETPYLLAGVLEELRGAETPVVYLPSVPVPANVSTVTTILNRHRMLYGRIVSPVTTQTLLGHEWSAKRGELLTVEAITIEEEQ